MFVFFSTAVITLGIFLLLCGSIIYFLKKPDLASGLQCSGIVLVVLSILVAFLTLRTDFRLNIPLFPVLNMVGFLLFSTGYLIMALRQKRRNQ